MKKSILVIALISFMFASCKKEEIKPGKTQQEIQQSFKKKLKM